MGVMVASLVTEVRAGEVSSGVRAGEVNLGESELAR